MPCVFPDRAGKRWMAGREGARCAFAMHPDIAELRVTFALYEIVADLIDQFERAAEDFAEGFSDLLEDDQPIDDGKVAARCDSVQVIAVVPRIGREIAEIDVGDDLWLFGARHLEIVSRQPMPP